MIHTHQFNGLPLRTGDVICTVDGLAEGWYGRFWLQVGYLLPGKVDHCAIYLGPAGRCIEAGPRGVIVYEMAGNQWDARPLAEQRGFVDRLYGVAYPLANCGSSEKERQIRAEVAQYCVQQAALAKPYNFDFLDPDTENAFYCSQLVYKAYLTQGINLNLNSGVFSQRLPSRIVFPEEIWDVCPHRRF